MVSLSANKKGSIPPWWFLVIVLVGGTIFKACHASQDAKLLPQYQESCTSSGYQLCHHSECSGEVHDSELSVLLSPETKNFQLCCDSCGFSPPNNSIIDEPILIQGRDIFVYTTGEDDKTCAEQLFSDCSDKTYCLQGKWARSSDREYCCGSSCVTRQQETVDLDSGDRVTIEKLDDYFIIWYGQELPVIGSKNYVSTTEVGDGLYYTKIPGSGDITFKVFEKLDDFEVELI